jgi:hypothetical protein
LGVLWDVLVQRAEDDRYMITSRNRNELTTMA